MFGLKNGNTSKIAVTLVFLFLLLLPHDPTSTIPLHMNRIKTLEGNPSEVKNFFYNKLPQSIRQETYSDPILITSDTEFRTTAQDRGWPGDGSAASPFLIDGITVYGPGSNLIDIQNTEVHFQISNCTLSGGKHGIHISKASNGRITNNNIFQNEEDGIVIIGEPQPYKNGHFFVSCNVVLGNGDSGIFFSHIHNSLIFNNTIDRNFEDGISLNIGKNITVISNTLTKNSLSKGEAIPPFAGVSLILSNNCSILDNFVFENQKRAIQTSTSDTIVVKNNFIHNCLGNGIDIRSSQNSTIINNTITEPQLSGIIISLSINNLILNNTIAKTNSEGVLVVDGSNFNKICNNDIIEANSDSILLKQSENNMVSKNFAYKGKLDGIQLEFSDSNVISENEFMNNDEQGISFLQAHDNYIYKNTFRDNGGQGISIDRSSNNTIIWNDFERNTRLQQQKISQGHDNRQGDIPNNFTNNYWDDHNNIDNNFDCFADEEYTIAGSGNENSDLHPLIRPSHCYTTPPPSPTILYPNGGELLKGSVAIVWTASNDSFYPEKVRYSVFYSEDGGINWEPIVDALNLSQTTFNWPTQHRDDGENYLLMVNATNILGLTNNDISDNIFSIENHFFVPEPKIIFPKGGETLSGKVLIQWEKAEDIYGHEITYSVLYSADGGVTWVLLESNLHDTSYSWITTSVSDGSNNIIRINATCSEGKSKIDTTGEFSISNGPPSPLPLFLLVGMFGALGAAFFLGTRRGRASIRGLFTAAGLRDKEIAEYAKKAKKVAEDSEEN